MNCVITSFTEDMPPPALGCRFKEYRYSAAVSLYMRAGNPAAAVGTALCERGGSAAPDCVDGMCNIVVFAIKLFDLIREQPI